jgi:hypothetical protein
MQQETDDAWVSPQVGVVYSKESAKGGSMMTVGFAVLGAIVFLPFGAIDFGGIPLALRLLLAAVIGALAGGAIGAVAGPALSVRRPNDPLGAEKGVTVRVPGASPDVERAMAEARPIRLDWLADNGARLSTVTTEEQQRHGGTTEEVADHLRHPESDLRSAGEPGASPRHPRTAD